jgi:hypothetical protein
MLNRILRDIVNVPFRSNQLLGSRFPILSSWYKNSEVFALVIPRYLEFV